MQTVECNPWALIMVGSAERNRRDFEWENTLLPKSQFIGKSLSILKVSFRIVQQMLPWLRKRQLSPPANKQACAIDSSASINSPFQAAVRP